MSLWRSIAAKRRIPVLRYIERLDERIVPDTTGTTMPDPTSTTTQTTTDPAPTPTQTGTSSTTTAADGTTTTTTTGPDGTITVIVRAPDGTLTTTITDPDGTVHTTVQAPDPAPETATVRQDYAVVTDAGKNAIVRVYDSTGTMKHEIAPYPTGGFRGGARVAIGDVTGDGVADIVTGPGPGMRPLVKVFDGLSGQQILGFNAYDEFFRGGVNVAVADMNGDGRADIITGAGDGGGSHVKIFDGAGLFPSDLSASIQLAPGPNAYLLKEFFAYDAKYLVGARVAVADIDGDGHNDIVTAPGTNGGPHIRVFNGMDGTIYREWFAYDPLFRGGVFVAAGDLNGDGKADVITGMGANGITQVKAFNVQTTRAFRSFIAESESSRSSVRVGVMDYDKDGDLDILTAVRNKVSAFDGKTFVRLGGLMPFDPSYTGGVFFG